MRDDRKQLSSSWLHTWLELIAFWPHDIIFCHTSSEHNSSTITISSVISDVPLTIGLSQWNSVSSAILIGSTTLTQQTMYFNLWCTYAEVLSMHTQEE